MHTRVARSVCRGRFECCRALLRAGADPNYMNRASDLALFWAVDGGVEIIKLFHEYGADLDARTPKVCHISSCSSLFQHGSCSDSHVHTAAAVTLLLPHLSIGLCRCIANCMHPESCSGARHCLSV